MADLCALGARRLVRVGTATATDPRVAPGTLVAVTRALAGDGASRALLAQVGGAGAGPGGADAGPGREPDAGGAAVTADPALTTSLAAAADAAGAVACTDLLRAPAHARDVLAWDLQTAAFLAAAAAGGARAAAVLLVVTGTDGGALAPDDLVAAERRAGRAALAALGPAPTAP